MQWSILLHAHCTSTLLAEWNVTYNWNIYLRERRKEKKCECGRNPVCVFVLERKLNMHWVQFVLCTTELNRLQHKFYVSHAAKLFFSFYANIDYIFLFFLLLFLSFPCSSFYHSSTIFSVRARVHYSQWTIWIGCWHKHMRLCVSLKRSLNRNSRSRSLHNHYYYAKVRVFIATIIVFLCISYIFCFAEILLKCIFVKEFLSCLAAESEF